MRVVIPSHLWTSVCSRVLLGLIVLAMVCPLRAASEPSATETDFLLRVAESRACSARTPTEFKTAAEAYRRVYQSGARNNVVLGNMGNLLILSGQRDAALEALLEAERLAGTTWELSTSLQALTAPRSPDDTPPSLPWSRIPLFWHYRLAASTRMTIALAGWCLLWGALCLRRLGFRRTAKPAIILAIACMVLFGTSALHSIEASSRYTPALPATEEVTP